MQGDLSKRWQCDIRWLEETMNKDYVGWIMCNLSDESEQSFLNAKNPSLPPTMFPSNEL